MEGIVLTLPLTPTTPELSPPPYLQDRVVPEYNPEQWNQGTAQLQRFTSQHA